jgi:hypothetical protein
MEINYKNILWKKKDKDCFWIEVLVLIDGKYLQIWEVSLENKIVKLSHWTDNVGEGLPILLPS